MLLVQPRQPSMPGQGRPRHSQPEPQNSNVQSPRRSTRKKPVEKMQLDSQEDLDAIEVEDMPQIAKPRRGAKGQGTKPAARKNTKASKADLGDSKNPVAEEFEYLEIFLNGEEKSSSEGEDHNSDDGSSKNNRGRAGSRQARFDRSLRLAARHVHLMSLFEAYRRKNLFLTTPLLRAELLSQIPPHLLRQFSPEILADGRTLINSLSMLSTWWKNSRAFGNSKQLSSPKRPSSFLPISWLSERRHDIWLRSIAGSKEGGAEDLVALFTCIIRALGLQARYICSLQPNLIRPSESVSALPNATEASPGKAQTPDKSVKNSIVLRNPPIFWTEIYHPTEHKWIPVDCLRGIVNDRLSMEPSVTCKSRTQHLFVIGYDSRGNAVDVTRRYSTRYFGVAARLRRHDEHIIRLLLSNHIPLSDPEEAELASLVDGEVIPTTLAGFQGHGRYMLESQLKKYEVFWPPDAGLVGQFKGQPVRLRSVVQKARSKESWYTQFGRIIKEGEAPCKQVKLPKKPGKVGKKKANDWEKALKLTIDPTAPKETVLQPLYGEWQTEPFSPPIAVDGQVPRNKFGNVDLYLPSMLPIGCVWIDDDSAYLAAKDLGVDYAAACVRFAFSGRIAVPNLQGIVLCAQFEGAVRKRLKEMRAEIIQAKIDAEVEKAAKRARLEKRKAKIMQKLTQHHKVPVGSEDEVETKIVSALAENQRPTNEEELEDLF